MRLQFPLVALSAVLSLSLGACDGESSIRINTRSSGQASPEGVLRVIQTLQCPQTEGVLTRKGAPSVDGLSCTYSGPRGSEVVLNLTPLNGREPRQILTEFETRLKADMPDALNPVASTDAHPTDSQAASKAVTEPSRSRRDTAVVRLPGLSITADDTGARVRIGGLKIVADDTSSTVTIDTPETDGAGEALHIRANDNTAEIRTHSPGGGVRSTYILADDAGSTAGWRLVGFEARGPLGGPLVIATIRSKARHEDDLFNAAKALVTANVGE